MKARDIMTKNPVTVHKQDRIENVLTLMRKHNISKVPVVDEGKLVGIITDGEVLEELGAFKNRAMSPSNLHVSGAMLRKFESVAPESEVKLVVAICQQEGVGMVPVVSGSSGNGSGKLEGVITKADLLPLVTSDQPLGAFMKRTLHSVHATDRVIHARRLMMDHGIERLPVLESGRIVGILGELDLALALDDLKKHTDPEHQKNQLKNLYVSDVMRTSVITAPATLKAKDAAALLRKEDIGCLPVVSSTDHIEGLVTRTDLIRLV